MLAISQPTGWYCFFRLACSQRDASMSKETQLAKLIVNNGDMGAVFTSHQNINAIEK